METPEKYNSQDMVYMGQKKNPDFSETFSPNNSHVESAYLSVIPDN